MLEVKRHPTKGGMPHKKTTYKETSNALSHIKKPVTAKKAKMK